MASDPISFIHKNGKIIPIRAAAGGAARGAYAAAHRGAHVARLGVAGAAAIAVKKATDHKPSQEHFKVNKGLDALGLGTAIASGVIGAATFAGGAKTFWGGAVATHAIDALGVGVNAASVAGKGHTKERVKQGAKQELRNLAIGNAIYGAGLLGIKKNRAAAVGYAKAGVAHAKKLLDMARMALRVA